MFENNKISFLYNPKSFPDKELISNFVIRLKEFESLFESIKSDDMSKPPQHYLILGQRGYGKTTLLIRLKLEIKKDSSLYERFIPVLFDEEQYNISNLAKLWEETINKISQEDNLFHGSLKKIDELYERESPEEEIYHHLICELKKNKKKIILMIDNFGDILERFSKKEIQRLREVLITSSEIKLIAASSVLLESFYEYTEPFFEFFRNISLNELNEQETKTFLQKLGESNPEKINKIINEQPERIEALRRLTGGVPRTIALLFEIFVDDISGNSFHDLEILLDRVTPLYKQRMDNLSSQQQTIVDSIAMNWDAISTKEIAKSTRLSSKTVSAQLTQLIKNQIIEKVETGTKNHLYLIKERFFNIYYLMRYGNKRDKKILWLIKFFEIWLDREELIEKVKKHINILHEKKIDERYAYHVSSALARTSIPLDIQDTLIKETREYFKEKKSEYINDIDKSKLEVINEIEEYVEKGEINIAYDKLLDHSFEEGEAFFYMGNILNLKNKNSKSAEEYYLKAIEKGDMSSLNNLALLYETEFKDYKKSEEYFLKAIEKGDIGAMNNLALLYETEFKDYKKSEEYYLKAVKKGNVEAMNNLALLYKTEFKDYKKSKEYYLKAIEKGYVSAMYNLALLYKTEFKDYKKSEEYYLKAIEKGHVNAMNNLALLYETEFKDYKKSEEYYLKAIEKGHVNAMNNLALLYKTEFKDYKKSEEYYLKAIDNGDIKALNNIANLYKTELKDYKKAEEYYLKAIDKNVVEAMNNLALLYQNVRKDYKKAEECFLKAIDNGDFKANNNLAVLYQTVYKDYQKAIDYFLKANDKNDVNALFNLALLYQNEYKDYKKAEEYYLKACDNGNLKAMNNLAYLYRTEWKDYDKAIRYFNMAIEKGDVTAMYNLALLYQNDLKDHEKAKYYYQQAIENGDERAMFNLASMYEIELKDPINAEKYYLLAIDKNNIDAMNNLALLYQNEYKDYSKAEKYYLKAISYDSIDAMNNLAVLYLGLKKNKNESLNLVTKAYTNKKDIDILMNYISILAWNNEIEKSINLLDELIEKKELTNEHFSFYLVLLELLLAKKQINYVYKIFEKNSNDIKDRFKPLYYAVLKLMGEKYQDEYSRMGGELKETVEEILKEIENFAIEYA